MQIQLLAKPVTLPMWYAISLFSLSSIPILWAQNNEVLIQDGGQVQTCDAFNPCPSGYVCQYAHFLPGVKICYRNGNGAGGIGSPSGSRPGRCALPNEPPAAGPSASQAPPAAYGYWAFGQVVTRSCGSACIQDNDCLYHQQKCCYSISCGRSCSSSVPFEPGPRVTVILEGSESKTITDRTVTNISGTVALVQSQGKNYLWDTGSIAQRTALIKNLREKAGLELDDISAVFISSGSLEHVANIGLFPDQLVSFGKLLVVGPRQIRNELGKMPTPDKYFVNGDRSVEVISTPGHTMLDTSMLVYNVTGVGTVALVGDLVLYANDWDAFAESAVDANIQKENRRKLFCLASYVLPGHGPMFLVTEEIKIKAGGCK